MPALILPLAGLSFATPFAAAVWQFGASLLLSAASRALAGKPKIAQSDVLRQLALPNSLPPKRFVYGFSRVFGTWAPGWVVRDGVLYGCVILNSRPSDGTSFKLFADKREVTLSGTVTDFASGASATAAPFAGYLKCWLGLGAQTAPPTQIMTEAGDATGVDATKFWSSDGWRGLTVLWLRLDQGPSSSRSERWPRTPPEIEVEMRWSKVWDLRIGGQSAADPATWTWSENQALCLLDAVRVNPIRRRTVRQVLLPEFQDAADVADQNVAIAAGGTEKRYPVGGVIVWAGETELLDQLAPLAQAGAGDLIQAGGRLGYAPGAWHAPVLTVTDVLDGQPFQFTRLVPGRDLPRAVRASFVDPAAQYEMSSLREDSVPGGAGTDGSDDGVETVELRLVHSATQAMRIQRIVARQRGMQRRLKGELPPTALDLVAGSHVTVALPRAGDARNGTYVAVQMHPAVWLEDENGVALRLPVEMRETSADVYAWATTDEQVLLTAPFTPADLAIALPGTLSVTTGPGIDLNTGGTIIPRLKFAFDPSGTAGVEGYEWEWSESTIYQTGGYIDGAVRDAGGDVFGYIIPSAGATVRIRVRAVRGAGRSGWREVTGVSIAFIVSGAAMLAEPGRVRVTGTGPSPNLSGVKVYRAATGAGFGAAVAVSAVLPVASGAGFNVVAGDAAATNLFVNGDFASGGTWTLGTGWSIGAGVATHATPTAGALTQAVSLVAADTYRFTVSVTATSGGNIVARLVGATDVDSANINAVGVNQRAIVAPATPTAAGFNAGATAAMSIDDAQLVRQTATTLAMGTADFYVVPVSTTGVEGTPSGPFALTIP